MQVLTLALVALLAPAAAPAPSAEPAGVKWVHDDWAKAKAEAKESHQLVAVDVWATWCHTCLSMKNFVLTDPKIVKLASEKHVWLALDYDRPENGAFFAKIPVAAFPTFLVVDPKTDTVVARWVGSGTADQMAAFYGAADTASKDPLVLGHRALAKDRWPEARAIFEKALAKPGLEKSERTKLLGGWIEALWKIDPKLCAKSGLEHLAETDDTAPGVDYVSMVAMCAEELDPAAKTAALSAVRDRLAAIADRPSADLAIDDRSGLYSTLTDAYDALGDAASAEKTVAARAKLLEDAAAAAKTPAERATFDAHRLECYLRQKRWAEAEKMLTASENAQPKDFNHPWRLAKLYLEQGGKTNEGLAAIDRALTNGYGARRLRLWSTKIDLLVQKKSYDWAKESVAQAKQELAKLPASQVRPAWVKELDKKLEDIAKREKERS